jgi:hypothetical protein
MDCKNEDDDSELQLIATVPTSIDDEYEYKEVELTDKDDEKTEWHDDIVVVVDPDDFPLHSWDDLKDIVFINVKQCEQTRLEYARSGFDNMNNFQRFKALAAALVLEKEAEMARSCRELQVQNDEKDLVVEESIECVPKSFLDDIRTEAFSLQEQHLGNESIRIISVGELLSLLEV